MKFEPFALMLTALLISGCISSGTSDIDVEDRLVGKTITGEDHGEGYLDESGNEVVYTLELGPDQFLTHFYFILTWYDEPPVERATPYLNYGDMFTLTANDGKHITRMTTTENAIDSQGRAGVNIPGEVVYNQSSTGGCIITVDITLLHADDHYPVYANNENLKVDDVGNEYSWAVEYTYVHKDL